MQIKLFDAHTHLNFEKYTDEERRTLASEIGESELACLIDVAYDVKSAQLAVADATAHEWCYAAVGIHPSEASDYKGLFIGEAEALGDKSEGDKAAAADSEDDKTKGDRPRAGEFDLNISEKMDADIDKIRRLAADKKAVAIGEIGLDYYYGTDDRDEQQELFRRQIRLANELRLPIMIHSRDAHQLTMDILKEEGAFSEDRKSWFPRRPAAGALKAGAPGCDIRVPGEREEGGILTAADARVQMHCFSGSWELAMEYIKLGASISLGGPITFKNGKKAAEVARQIPLEYLLSETDAPYLAPEPHRGRPNKPQYIEHVVRRMALLKGLSYEETAAVLFENGKRFFSL